MHLVDRNIPLDRFGDWFAQATNSEDSLPEAVALATADGRGRPSARMVLMKGWGEQGWDFYTNLESRKGLELQENPQAALLFHWKSVKRQIRIEGRVAEISDEEADAYFATRGRDSQIGAWASDQSRIVESRFELQARVAKFAAKFLTGPVPRPDYWSGFRLKAETIEFWAERKFRLHERTLYTRQDGGWSVETLYP